MAHLNTEPTEEDAADLQFPKDLSNVDQSIVRHQIVTTKLEDSVVENKCFICDQILYEPYIRCAVCEIIFLCKTCFCSGQEKLCHTNNHDYVIIKNNFSLFQNSNWNAKEEIKFLNLLLKFGYGNWTDISLGLLNKTPEECEKHYLTYYLTNSCVAQLPKFNSFVYSYAEVCTYSSNRKNTIDPPRYTETETNYKLIAGYNPVRSDFEINFDNHAEMILNNLSARNNLTNDKCLNERIHLAMIEIYNRRLKSRKEREQIIKNHGLISIKKKNMCFDRYSSFIDKQLVKRLHIFSQFFNGINYDSLMETFYRIGELKQKMHTLFKYRSIGVKSLDEIYVYTEVSKIKNSSSKILSQYTNASELKNVQKFSLASVPKKRQTQQPINLYPNMPGYEKLSEKEKELCAILRLVPKSFIDHKHLLITEYNKFGKVTLSQARHLLKIDVNKTKKIFEYFSKEGWINRL
ncbi:hypothetical protein TKK_0007840 [Trichogramma kaykai]|uniref:Transcriptional adapter n=1 Tax=Trichogramma kaykai TaxID=54128 RepID=A0ABD2X8X6_9HYME